MIKRFCPLYFAIAFCLDFLILQPYVVLPVFAQQTEQPTPSPQNGAPPTGLPQNAFSPSPSLPNNFGSVGTGLGDLQFPLTLRPSADAPSQPALNLDKPQSFSPVIAKSSLIVTAAIAGKTQPLTSGLLWRIFAAQTSDEATREVIDQSFEAAPFFNLPQGDYIIHVSYGLASAMKRVHIGADGLTTALFLNAGGLRLKAMLGDADIAQKRLSIRLYVPEPGNSEAKLVVPDVHSGQILLLPEGNYHLVSTYLEPIGEARETNSQVTTDIHVTTGNLLDVTLRHRAATITLKLVGNEGGEALADTIFNVLTPGGDLVRELAGAFPSLVLAEGDYIVVARHAGKTYQTSFKVEGAKDSDVEILAKNDQQNKNDQQ